MTLRTTGIATGALLRAALMGGVSFVATAGFATAATAQTATGVVTGQVVDDVTGNNLQGVLVRIPSQNLRATSDREGMFRFGRVPAGTHEVIIQYQNKETETRTVTVTAGQTESLAIRLVELGSTQDQIVVRGTFPIADSEAAAYSRQRASDNLINVVAADTIGRFPDQNVAAALSRLPGISVERDQGQERYVNLRGAPNKWTTVSFNGLNVVSPEGRASRFDTIPNAIVSSIEATKAVTADMSAESIAGNINIITRNPFDRKGIHVSGEGAIGFLQLGGGEQSNLSATVSNTFANDTMGFLVSGSFYRRNQVTDNIENRFENASEAEGTAGEDLIWSRQADIRVYNLVRANKGLTGRFDWRPNANHELFVSSIFTEFTDDENRDQYIFDFDSDASGQGCYANVEAPCNNTPNAGTVFGAQIDATFNTNNYRENIFTNTIGGDHLVGDWDLSWRLNTTHTEDEFFAPARWRFESPSDPSLRPSVAYDYSDPDFPRTVLFETIDNGDDTYALGDRKFDINSNDLELDNIERIDRMERTQAYTAKFDAERELEFLGNPTTFKAGVQYDYRRKKETRTDTLVDPDSLADAGLGVPTLADIQKREEWPGGFPLDFVASLYQTEVAVETFNALERAGGAFTQPETSEESFYRVEESIYAAYVMGTMQFDWGNVVAGLRVEASENDGQALGSVPGAESVNGFTLIEAGDDRVDVFPSVHINYDLTDNRKIRLSLNSGLSRADFDERAPNFSINDESGVISGGNPFVNPEKTYGIDLYYEHYLEPLGIFSVGAFYKYIQDPLVDRSVTFGSDQFNTDLIDRSEYEFRTLSNGDQGYYYGLEASYAQKFDFLPDWGLPEWTDGFGFNGNITWVDSEITLFDGDRGEETTRDVPLEGSSDITYNTSAYWEKYDLSLRVNWQWRTDWINSYGSTEEFDRYWSQLGRLSFGARYQVNDNLEWFFDANNLTDQLGRRIRQNRGRVYEVEGFGERYLTGVRFNF